MALTYHSDYFIRSTTAVNTVVRAPVFADDTEAIQNFTTDETLIMLVIYNACNRHGQTEEVSGKVITIEVDGVDLDGIGVRHDQGPDVGNGKNGCTVYYLAELAAGDHTVKGRFARSAPAGTVTIGERQLAIFLFQGTSSDYGFTSSTVLQQTNTLAFVDDPSGSGLVVATSEDNEVVLVLYSGSSRRNDDEHGFGKEIAIQVDGGADMGWHGESGYVSGIPPVCYSGNGCTTHVIWDDLGAGNHTFDGRFASNSDADTVSIHDRQLAVLVFNADLLHDQVLDDTTVQTTSSKDKVDDPPATINRILPGTYETLILYGCYNYHDTLNDYYGRKAGIMVDDVDYSQGYQSASGDYKCGNTVCHVIELAAGAHTIKGRFATNREPASVRISRRTMCVLYFPLAPVGPHKQSILKKMMYGGL